MKTPALESLFNKVTGLKPITLIKKTSRHVFFCEFCKILRKPFFTENIFYSTPPEDCFWIFLFILLFLTPYELVKISLFLFLKMFYQDFLT